MNVSPSSRDPPLPGVPSPRGYPTGGELIERYLEPLANGARRRDPNLQPRDAISRVGFDKAKTKGRERAPFEIRYQNGKGPEVLLLDCGPRGPGSCLPSRVQTRIRPE